MRFLSKTKLVAVVVAAGMATFIISQYFGDNDSQLPSRMAAGGNNGSTFPGGTQDAPISLPSYARNIQSGADTDADSQRLLDGYVLSTIQDKTLSNKVKFDILWGAYLKNSSSELGTYFLDSLQGLVPLPNADRLLAELSDPKTSPNVKSHLMRLLETAYLQKEGNVATDGDVGRQSIVDAIKRNLYNPDSSVAREAVLTYSRIAPPAETSYALSDAYKRNIISEPEFIRESAFKLPSVSDPQQQNAMLSNLISLTQSGRSEESSKALIASMDQILQNPDSLTRLDGTTKNSLENYLRSNEPKIVSSRSDYDLADAVAYCNWLNSYASVNSKSNGGKLGFVLNTVSNSTTDTQKIVAVLISPQGQEVISAARQDGKLGAIQSRLAAYSAGLSPETAAYSAYQSALAYLR